VTYSYVVTNNSDFFTVSSTVSDDKLGSVGSFGPLAPGASATLSKVATVNSTVTNIGTANGSRDRHVQRGERDQHILHRRQVRRDERQGRDGADQQRHRALRLRDGGGDQLEAGTGSRQEVAVAGKREEALGPPLVRQAHSASDGS